ncbi:MAG TPA: hypothetical protein VGB13_03745 [Candidatus Krumholzibacteria bacterium]|jgi:hypothetical protein
MKQGSRSDRLSEVRRQFERWRKNRPRGTRIPEDLWRAAAEAGCEAGVSKTAQVLHLDFYELRERTNSVLRKRGTAWQTRPVQEALPEGGFFELALGAPPNSECVLEMEDPRGARLRMELKGATPAHLETLARTIWSLAQ